MGDIQPPTTADYAMHSADTSQRRIDEIEKRLAELDRTVEIILDAQEKCAAYLEEIQRMIEESCRSTRGDPR